MRTDAIQDTHCHLGRYKDPSRVLNAAAAAGVAILAVTEDPDEYRRLRTRLGPKSTADVAIGLHPQRAESFGPNQLARFFRLIPQAGWIGEVGLDYSRGAGASIRAQQRVFDAVLTEAQPGRHPMTVHSRGAEKDVIRHLSQASLPAVLHWYSGPLGLIDDALQAGLYFSFNVAMTRSRRFASLTKAIPNDRILLETDGPYAKDQGHAAEPNRLDTVIARLADALETDIDQMRATILANQASFLSHIAGS